eukprot:CAMPEP_0172386852 /NCGR_PEP_ID=MMETSP1061-20121228/4302_1 /TAXON_ID=37318 /ORGANISM="Pseudo-nitzschia pungens, Strain cf. pungens" /LENGTH=399 /DNA_ID=CAMNT_0013116351 /DNA_START=488 /DNA_END=1683 /DNA_ORIENTATION=-
MPSIIPSLTLNRGKSLGLLLRRHYINGSVKKKTTFPSPIYFWLNVFLFFSLFDSAAGAVAEVGAGADLVPEIDDCSRCSPGGRCMLDAIPSFGVLFGDNTSGQASVRCDCFDGFSGPLCDRKLVVGTSNGADHETFDGDGISNEVSNDIIDDNNDTALFDDFFLRLTGDCPFECQNGGQCLSVYGGITYACVCPMPFWGSQCEFDSLREPCELDCSNIPIGSIPREGAFCVDSPQNIGPGDSHTCVHCQEIPIEDEPICENKINCLNGGICKVKYLFVDATEGNETSTSRPFTCSATVSVSSGGVGEIDSVFSFWEEKSPYKLECDCPIGFQGEFCEEIDLCGGCHNNGYCISEDTPGDLNMTDDFYFGHDDDDDDDDDDHISMDDVSNLFGDDLFNLT